MAISGHKISTMKDRSFHPKLPIAFLSICFLFPALNAYSHNSIKVSGQITENKTWSYDTVRITGDLLIRDSVTLTIEPGTRVEFQGNYTLEVWGRLLAVGTESEKILFTIHDTTDFMDLNITKGGWNKIYFNNGHPGAGGIMYDNDTSKLIHCVLQYSKNLADETYEFGSSGGAVTVKSFSKVVVSDCRIVNNYSYRFGGGIALVMGADIKILNNEIDSNMASLWGGGIMSIKSKPIIRNNRIRYNKVFLTSGDDPGIYDNGGGGICCNLSEALIEDNLIQYNVAPGGAGIGSIASRNIIRNNTFTYNETLVSNPGWWWVGGGGLAAEGSLDLIMNNIFSNNTANTGGAIHIRSNSPQIINNLIVNNTCGNNGGGILLAESRSLLLNNTIAYNHSGEGVGGIAIMDSKPELINNIIWGNTQTVVGAGSQIKVLGGISNPDILYCVLQGGRSDILGNYQGEYLENLETDPGFVFPSAGTGSGYDGLEGDWSLDTNSACLNSGKPDVSGYALPFFDVYARPRIKHGRIDIGVSEVHIECLWIEGSIGVDTILIADTIKVTGNLTIEDDIKLTIVPDTRVEFQGHFGVLVQGTLDARGTEKYPIHFTMRDTLDFSIDSITKGGWSGIRFPNSTGSMSDNDTSIFEYCTIEFVKPERESAHQYQGAVGIYDFSRIRLQNCTIRNNNTHYAGGGIYAERSEPVIIRCKIFHNRSGMGGGIYCADSEILIRNCEIANNSTSTQNGGGGIRCFTSKVTIENNLIYQNCASEGYGGGLFLEGSYGLIRNNRVMNNNAYIWGGGICCHFGISAPGTIDFVNNLICNNSAHDGGGTAIRDSDNTRLVNNTICFNEVPDAGGGLYIGSSNPLLVNNIIWGNRGCCGGQVTINDDISMPYFSYCNIQDSLHGIGRLSSVHIEFPNDNITNTKPHFMNPPAGIGSDTNAVDADFSLLPISGCIDAGKPDIGGLEIPLLDIYSNPRINNERIDIGAMENQDEPAQILEQPGNRIACEGETVVFRVQTSDTVLYQWQRDGSNIPGAVYPILSYDSVTSAEEGNYRCIVSNAYGKLASNQVYLLVKEAPEILTEPLSQWLGIDRPFTFKVNVEGTMPLSYQWKKDGIPLEGRIAPEWTLEEPAFSDEGVYTCVVSNSCGANSSSPATIYLAPQICMVTVSTSTGYNLVVWEKLSIAPILQYNIYRESRFAGVYDLLASVPADTLSIYTDTTADPSVQAYLYKITATDTAGEETHIDLCRAHKTIHLLATKNPETNATQLDWDRYVGFEYGTYEIFRSDTSFDFTSIHTMASSTSTWADANPGGGLKYYRIAAIKLTPCIPTGNEKAGTSPYYHSLSNMDDNKKLITRGTDESLHPQITIYPNPVSERAIVQFYNPGNEPFRMVLVDMSGRILMRADDISTDRFEITRDGIPPGLYLMELLGPRVYRSRILME